MTSADERLTLHEWPKRVFSLAKTIDNIVMPDGSWTERTLTFDDLATPTQTRYVEGNGRRVDVYIGDAPGKGYKQNPSLQELSHSKTSAANIQELPNNLSYQRTDLYIDLYNIYNAAADIQTEIMNTQGLSRGTAFVQANEIAFSRGVNGELMGVHPTKAGIIRDKWNSIFQH